MSLPIDLSIIIVSYEVRELVGRCLDSLHPALQLEVFVVDNASKDGTAEFVRDCFPGVHLIANSDNRGFAAANNQALEHAAGRYLMLLNPDTEVKPGALETLVSFMDLHPRAGICGPQLCYADGTRQQSAFGFPTLAQVYLDLFPSNWRVQRSRINGRYPTALYERGQPFRVDHPLGAAFLVRRTVAEQVGFLDERFYIYCEEIDWALRIRAAGWESWCVPGAVIVHHEARSTRQFRDRMFVELWRARFSLFARHYSRAFNASARLLVRLGMRRAEARARAEAGAGRITRDEMERQVAAYRRVAAMARNG